MEKIKITTEFIKLDQFLKWIGLTDNGAEAKTIISEEKVRINGEIELRRGKKLKKGDTVEVNGNLFLVEKE